MEKQMTITASVQKYVTMRLADEPPAESLYTEVIAIVDRALIETTLKHTRGNQSKAARVLGINRNTLLKKMRKLKGV